MCAHLIAEAQALSLCGFVGLLIYAPMVRASGVVAALTVASVRKVLTVMLSVRAYLRRVIGIAR
jgi:hypothetical protein